MKWVWIPRGKALFRVFLASFLLSRLLEGMKMLDWWKMENERASASRTNTVDKNFFLADSKKES